MTIESVIAWLHSIDEIEYWSAPAQDNCNLIMRLEMVVIYWNK